MKTRYGKAHQTGRTPCPAGEFPLLTNDPEDSDMSDPFTPQEDSWPLGLAPSLGNPLPQRMLALTVRRDQYGPPSRSVRLEAVHAPRLKPNEAKRILVAILATGPNFNTNFA